MKNFIIVGLIALTSLTAKGQQITGSSVFSPSPGGARILSGQGNTPTNPAIGFHSSVSTTALAQNDGLANSGQGLGIFRPQAHHMGFASLGVERMRITTNGYIGIGTPLPNGLLEIKKQSGNYANLILSGQEYYVPSLTGASSNGIALINGVNRLGNKQLWLADADNIATKNNTNGVLRLYPTTGAAYVEAIATDGTTPLNLLFQTTGGKVGIGTSTPSALFDVVNSNGTSMISLQQQADADNFVSLFNNHPGRSNMVVFQPIGLTSPSNPQWNVGRAYYANNSYVINTWDGSNNTARMMFTPSGNVGIGTTTPLHKLHVHDGALMVSGANNMGGPMIVFSDNVAPTQYPNGRWGIEYEPNVHGLNFWKPWNPSTGGGGNYYMLLKDDGKIGMGIDPTSCTNAFAGNYRLYVKDGIMTEKVKVAVACSTNWADYVFADNYKLRSLEEVEEFVNENNHLPGVPSANELVNEGLDLGKMQAKQMEKIEELTLYMIEMNKKIDKLEKENASLKSSSLINKN